MGRAIDRQTLIDLIIDAKRTDPETGSFTEWLADYLSEHLPALAQPTGWVSVEERLPSEEDDVLLLVKEIEHYGRHGEKRKVYHWVFTGWNVDGKWATTYCHGQKELSYQAGEDPRCEYKVTHWMPLPAPPEGER